MPSVPVVLLVLVVWMVAAVIVLWDNHLIHITSRPAPPDALPEIPVWVWSQDRVDAQFRAMTAPLCR